MYGQLFLLLFLVNIAFAGTRNLQEQPQNIFLLAGQSNMAGRGGVNYNTVTQRKEWNGVVPVECQPQKKILRLDAKLNWVISEEPLHKDIDYNKTNGVGLGMPFAHTLLASKPSIGVIGLVPCAHGGSKIIDWQPGTFLYERLITRANESTKNDGKLQGLIWWQGAADSEKKEDVESYKQNLIKFFNRVRFDLNALDLLILQIAIAPGKSEYSKLIRQTQLELKMPNLYTVDPPGNYSTERDGVHFTAESQVKLGRLLAETLYSITKHT